MVQHSDSVLDFEYRLWISFRSGTLGYSNICNTKSKRTIPLCVPPMNMWKTQNLEAVSPLVEEEEAVERRTAEEERGTGQRDREETGARGEGGGERQPHLSREQASG